jgi:hypothetical protein
MLFPEKCDYKETKKNENSLRLFLMSKEHAAFCIGSRWKCAERKDINTK